MSLDIKGIWKDGKILPLEEVEVEENTEVTITFPEKTDTPAKTLAGAWKNYKTSDGKTLEEVKREIYASRKLVTRKDVRL